MSTDYTMGDLAFWDARIREQACALGLDCYPQEFEICDHEQMLGYTAYSGMPSHYPHWSYGKSFEKLKTLYDHGMQGLPYEMVINSNPSLAYLMRDNTLLLQILTIAHVYGHNDFFKHNRTFSTTRPEFTIATFKAHAQRVRSYVEDPSIGADRVEHILDAAHALSLQCRRNLLVRHLSPDEERAQILAAATPPSDPFRAVHRRQDWTEPELRRTPLSPEQDLLLFLRDHNPQLAPWEQDLLTIVHEQTQYFLPQIDTKIMNEGWASFWHKRIVESLELPHALHLEFLVRHNQVCRPIPGQLNPYHLGLKVWEDVERRSLAAPTTPSLLFETREADRDTSFLRRWLTEPLMRDLDLFEYAPQGDDLVVQHVADDAGWRQVKDTLIRGVGTGSIPVIEVMDADYGQNRTLLLRHRHDGRDLQLAYAEPTLAYVYRLWGRTVFLETILDDKPAILSFNDNGFSAKPAK